jgi:hypothetical protein
MRLIPVLATLAIFLSVVHAQDRCATLPTPSNSRSSTPPLFTNDVPSTRYTGLESVTGGSGSALPEEIVIPVVVHVVYRTAYENISEDQILSQIESLNADFNRENPDFVKVPSVFASLAGKAGIRFRLATSDPQGRATTGIVRRRTERSNFYTNDAVKSASTGGIDGWDSRQYLNVWVCNMPSNLQGYATFPGEAPQKDGIVVRYDVFGIRGRITAPFDRGRTLTHEVGHWLGLRHLWGDIPCGDDGVHDTPRQRSGNRGTPQFPLLNTGCDNGRNGDMFMNFMDFSDDAALLMFTGGQVSVMRGQLMSGGPRHSLISSKGLSKPWNLTPVPASNDETEDRLKVHPNPASSSIRLSFIGSSQESNPDYSVTDASGRLLLSGRLTERQEPIDVSRLSEGVYFIRSGDRVTRFVKRN